MRTKKLFELEKAYRPYSEAWSNWLKSEYCLLTELESYAMEIHIQNGFQVEAEDMYMFYNRNEFTESLLKKLKDKSQILLYCVSILKKPLYHHVKDG